MTTRIRSILLASAGFALISLPLWVTADEPDLSYTWIEVDWAQVDPDDSVIPGVFNDSRDEDLEGFRAEGSLEITESIYAWGRWQDVDSSYLNTGILCAQVIGQNCPSTAQLNVDYWAVGVGYHFPLSDQLDLVAEAGWQKADAKLVVPVNTSFASEDDSDWLGAVGLRHRTTEALELGAKVVYTNAWIDDWGVDLQALYELGNSGVSLVGRYTYGEDSNGYNLGIRYSFD